MCIRIPQWVAGTREHPEVGVFTQTAERRRPAPWSDIGLGETVWMKWSGGPVVAKARIVGLRQLIDCSPSSLRTAVAGFGLAEREAYWFALPERFHALAVFLADEQWIDPPLTVTGRSYSSSWIVFPDSAARERWMVADESSQERRPRDPRGPRAAGAALRFTVFRRDSYTCQYCGRRAPDVELHVDHIVAWSKGGRTEVENLRTACRVCNLGKSARSA
jgi:5-methylcytosine-specific restriction endonuclease McrA